MTNTLNELKVEDVLAPVADDDFEDEVEAIIDVLPNELDRTWLDGLGEDPDDSTLLLGFWDAARTAIEAMLRAGYAITPPSK
jgi:hypothetical protein